MGGALRAELRKLRKRPSVWVLFGVLLATLALFGYLITYLFLVAEVAGDTGMTEDFLPSLLPDRFVAQAVNGLAGFGGAFALILGALAVGSEYGWRTVKSIATQSPTRLELGAGKVGALAVVTLVYTIAYHLVALLCSLLVAGLEGEPVSFPAVGTILGGIGAGWLIMLAWTAAGVVLAVAFRGTAMPIGLGLVYALVLETLALSLPLPESVADALRVTLLGPNATALSLAFGELAGGQAAMPDPVSAGQASAVLAIYVVVFVGVAAVVFRRRDIA